MGIRRKFFAQRAVRCRNTMPGGAADAPCLKAFRPFHDSVKYSPCCKLKVS